MAVSTLLMDPFGARGLFNTGSGTTGLYRLSRLEDLGLAKIANLPFSIRVLLESALRNCDGFVVSEQDVKNLAAWNAPDPAKVEIPFMPARVVLQDFTGVPCVVDLAAMRAAMQRLGGDPKVINPLIPVDLVIDHSVQVDNFGTPDALRLNVEVEFSRNRERYEFLRWGQKAFDNFRVVPPNVGIVHQVNLEYLAKGVFIRNDHAGPVALPDTLVGTDSHTTMINGLGIVGWGVGGIEAEAVMLGQPLGMLLPEVVGFELVGRLPAGTTATDLVLTCTEILRKAKVVGKFVEFFGPGVSSMSLPDRATIANMAPEYGATMGFFPIDAETLTYLRRTGRTEAEVHLVEHYAKEQQLFRTDDGPTPTYTQTMRLDLATVEPSLAGPKRPQDRVSLADVKTAFAQSLRAPVAERGFALDDPAIAQTAEVRDNGHSSTIGHGSVVIAAITSCTNTSNPSVMIAAGLLAKKAAARGLKAKPHVKTSLAPGSRVVTEYLRKSGLEAVAGASRLLHGGLRLHDLHRQQRPASRAGRQGRHRGRSRRRGRAQRQSQLRRPRESARESQLSRQPAARRGLRPRRLDHDRPDQRTARAGQGRPRRFPPRPVADPPGNRTDDFRRRPARHVHGPVRPRVRRQRNVEPHRHERGRALPVGREKHLHSRAAVFAGFDPRTGSDSTHSRRPRPRGARRFGHHRPHLAGRVDRQGQPRRAIS